MSELFIYHKEKIKVINPPHYQRFNIIIKKSNFKKRVYLTTLWLNAMRHKYIEYSYKEIYTYVKHQGLMELDDQYILDTLHYWNEKKPTWKTETHYEWNQQELFKLFKTKSEVNKFKHSIRNEYGAKKKHQNKVDLVLNFYNSNKELYYSELIEKLQKDVCKKTIDVILNENNIIIQDKSKSFILIERKLNDLFKYRINTSDPKITYEMLAKYIGVSLITLKRFFKENEMYRFKVNKHNENK